MHSYISVIIGRMQTMSALHVIHSWVPGPVCPVAPGSCGCWALYSLLHSWVSLLRSNSPTPPSVCTCAHSHVIEHIDGQPPLSSLRQRGDDGAIRDGITREAPRLHRLKHLQAAGHGPSHMHGRMGATVHRMDAYMHVKSCTISTVVFTDHL